MRLIKLQQIASMIKIFRCQNLGCGVGVRGGLIVVVGFFKGLVISDR
jgi:hypothetical protein